MHYDQLHSKHPLPSASCPFFVNRARHHALPTLRTFPQYAYLLGRGTWDAICRVFRHVQAVAQLSERWRYNASRIDSQFTGTRRRAPVVFGFTQAFDHMPRASLQQAFELLNIPPSIMGVLLQWHVDTKYILTYKGHTSTVPTYKGVRQGCRGAPFFWASFVALILNEVAKLTSTAWMHSSCTFYADGGHLCFSFKSMEGQVLDTLTKFGMTVNLNKSAVLLDLRGKQKTMVQKQHLRSRMHHQTLQIAGSSKIYDIPLKTSNAYLGVKISYQQTQILTMKIVWPHASHGFDNCYLGSRRGTTSAWHRNVNCGTHVFFPSPCTALTPLE